MNQKKSQQIGLFMMVVFSAAFLWALTVLVWPVPVVYAEDPEILTITVTSNRGTYFYDPGLDPTGGTVYFNSVGGEGAGQVLTVTVTCSGTVTSFAGAPAFNDTPPLDFSAPWQVTYTVEAGAGTQSGVVFTVTNASGTDTATITFTRDNTDPAIIMPTITEGSAYLYANGLRVYYGDDMGENPVAFRVRGNAQDSGAGLHYVTYSAALGEPYFEDFDNLAAWRRDYTADQDNTTSGVITATLYDWVGNVATQVFTYTRDITSPTISGPFIAESSPYLRANGTTVYYSNQMGSTSHSFAVQGNATDNGSSLYQATFSPALGSSPDPDDTPAGWSGSYDVESTDSGNGTITVEVHDNVSNWSQQTFDYIEDTASPTVTLTYVTPGSYDEDNPDDWLDDDGSNWYKASDFTGGNWEFTSTVTDTLSGLALANASWDHSNNAYDQLTYDPGLDGDGIFNGVNDDGDGTVTVTLTITDNVGNSASDLVAFNIDNTVPTITSPYISESSPYLHADGLTIYYGDEMGSVQDFYVNGSSNDIGVGLDRATFSVAFGATPKDDTTPSAWSGRYYPDNQDWGSDTITVTVTDWLGNAAYQTFDYLRDTERPTVSVTCPAVTSVPSWTVRWIASDTLPSSGLHHYDVQYKVGAADSWQDWHMNTLLTQDTFGPTSPVTVEDDHTYYFRVQATDNVSNAQQSIIYTTTYHSGIKRVFLPILMAPDPNWGFETCDFTSWQHGGQLAQSVSTAVRHSGSCSALLGSPSYACSGVPIGSAWLRRSVTVPSSGSPTLSFYYWMVTHDKTDPNFPWVFDDATPVPSGDLFEVRINGIRVFTDANFIKPEDRQKCPITYSSGWEPPVVYPLDNYKGKTIEIAFYNYNLPDPYYNTYTYIDDVSVK